MKARLEVISNVVVILAVVILGGLMARDRLLLSSAMHNTGELKAGVRLDPPAMYDWSKQSSTLLVALRRGCKYCERSIPFYQRLAVREQEQHLSTHLLGVIPSGESEAREYVAGRGLTLKFVPNADFAKLKIQATPTLVLVDAAGLVRKVWVGQLTDAEEAEVLDAVAR